MNRSTFLRVFDQDMARKVNDQLEEEGIHMMPYTEIVSAKRINEKEIEVELKTKSPNG